MTISSNHNTKHMQLNELGEFGLIGKIKELFSAISLHGCRGIGDDCAVIPTGAGESLTVTTDMLVEEIHFLRSATDPYRLGRKSLAVNLSDVAAMGATPFASFLSIALPRDVSAEWAEQFMEGYRSLSAEFGVALLGGDTTSAPEHIAINVVAVGRADERKIKYRSTAKAGDIIYVTGYLGDSAQGLIDICNGAGDSAFARVHLDPAPCVHEGIWLGQQPEVHAMMDLSDGLASDLRHILKASGVSAEVLLDKIPTKVDVKLAVGGGEDYQLLLTVAANSALEIAAAFAARFGKPLYEIGKIEAGAPDITWIGEKAAEIANCRGFSHF